MSEKLKPMGLFLDKFKEVNYVNTPGWYGSCIGVARLGGRNK